MKLSKKAATYLHIIGKTEDASVPLTKGFARQADELKTAGLAIYVSISQGGCRVVLTQNGLDMLDEVEA
jgi:hypothetical protein